MTASRIAGRPSRQSSHGKESIPRLEAGAGAWRAPRHFRHAREREIADRDHVRAGVVRPRVAAAVAEGVELLDIADFTRSAPSTQARRPISKVRCASGSNGPNGSPARVPPLRSAATRMRGSSALDGDDGGGQPDFDRRQMRSAIMPQSGASCGPGWHNDHSRSSRKGPPSWRGQSRAERFTAAIMRPSRPSSGRHGRPAWCWAWRSPRPRARARSSPRRGRGLSAQAEMNAPAVERLMPA